MKAGITKEEKPKEKSEIAQAWDEIDMGARVAFIWLALMVVSIVVLGIIFPIFGLIMLAIGVVVATVAAFIYLVTY